MARVLELWQNNLLGGLNQLNPIGVGAAVPAWNVGANQLSYVVNWKLSPLIGGLLPRTGSQRSSASPLSGANPVNGGFTWYNSPNASTELLAVCNTDLFTSPGQSAPPITWTNRGGTLHATLPIGFASFRDGSANVAYIADGGLLNKWNGTTLTENIASTPNVSLLAVFNQRLFAAGDIGAPDTIYWSGLNNGDTLGQTGSGGGSAVIRTFGQSRIVGLAVVGSSLLVFQERGISRFTGWGIDDFDIDEGMRSAFPLVSAVASSIQVAGPNAAYFATNERVYKVNETDLTSISDDLPELNEALASIGSDRLFATYNPNSSEYWVGGGASVLSTSYVFSEKLNAWTQYAFVQSGTMTSHWTNDSTRSTLAGYSDGHVRFLASYPTNVTDLSFGGGPLKDDVLSDGTGGNVYSATVVGAPLTLKRHAVMSAMRVGAHVTTASNSGTGNTPLKLGILAEVSASALSDATASLTSAIPVTGIGGTDWYWFSTPRNVQARVVCPVAHIADCSGLDLATGGDVWLFKLGLHVAELGVRVGN